MHFSEKWLKKHPLTFITFCDTYSTIKLTSHSLYCVSDTATKSEETLNLSNK